MSSDISPVPVPEDPTQQRSAFPRRSLTIIDICGKRRSGSCQSLLRGKPFIRPLAKQSNTKTHKIFFRNCNETIPTVDALIECVQNMPQSQAFKVAIALRISPPNQAKLVEFVSRIARQDEGMIATVQDAINSALEGSNVGPQRLHYDFFDCRYTKTGRAEESKRFEIGEECAEFRMQLPRVDADTRVVLQSFSAGVVPPSPRWPLSLRISVNGKLVKPPGAYRWPLIDLTPFGEGSTVSVTYDVDGSNYIIMLRLARFTSYDDLVTKMQVVDEHVSNPQASIFCPLTGTIMEHPGRGKDCQHFQCFDVKKFMELSVMTQTWICPICRSPLSPDDLVISGQMRSFVHELEAGQHEPSESVDTTEPVVDPLTFQLFSGKEEEEWEFDL